MMTGTESEKETLLRDTLLVTVTKKDESILKCKQVNVTFERGRYNNETCHRLVIARASLSGFGTFRRQEIVVTKHNFCGIVNGSAFRRIIYSSSYCPTITIVTLEWSIVLTFSMYNELKRKRKFDSWISVMQKELDFGGYWSVQEVNIDQLNITSGGTAALLCATKTKLSVLTRNPAGTYVTKVLLDIEKMVRSERYTDSTKNAVRLKITFSVNDNPLRLMFVIKNDQGMTRDLFNILDTIKTPVIRRTESERPKQSGADVNIYTRRDYKDCISRRYSKDELSLLPLRPRKFVQPTRKHQVQTQAYDLNAISQENSVQDALHFYENLQFYRERNPPDVVINRPSPWETEEYWGIVNTLTEVLRKRTPTPDTLNLPCKLRRKLCFYLLDNTLPSWKDLADCIGLTQDAVRMTETLFQSGMDLNPVNANDILTPPECILRHWQFAHNQHSQGLQSKALPYPCSRHSLTEILENMERHDLVQLLQQQATPTNSSNTSQHDASNISSILHSSNHI